MSDLRTAAQQALEALERYRQMMFAEAGCRWDGGDAAITALRAALAQQDEPVEPVAWSGYDLDGMVEALSRVVEAHYQRANPFQNPVDMDAQMALRILRGFIPAMKAYTAPPQRKPLTEEVAALTAQRDALLEALKPMIDLAEFWINHRQERRVSEEQYNVWIALGHESSAMLKARAAIKAVEEAG